MKFSLIICLSLFFQLIKAQSITANYTTSGIFCAGSSVCFIDLSVGNTSTITSWDWFFSDATPNSNLQNPCHSFAFPATYTVMLKVKDSNGNMDSTYQSITIGACTKVKENLAYRGIKIFPNPSQNILNIDIGTLAEKVELKIYNSTEELVLIKNIVNQKSTVDISQMQSGIYYYKISINDITIKTDKLIIIK